MRVALNIVFLDCGTLGHAARPSTLRALGNLTLHKFTERSEIFERIQDADVVITNKVPLDKATIERSPRLRLVVVTASVPDIIDSAAADRAGVEVRSISGYATKGVAQFTMGLILSLVCRLPYFTDFVNSGRYSEQRSFAHVGDGFLDLFGMRLGIVGMGRIGSRLADIALPFGVEVVYFSSTDTDRDPRFPRLPFDELLTTSDIVSIHAPLTEKTAHIIDMRALLLMKRHAILLNTGRGGIINEGDLAIALRRGLIGGCALDVFEDEPLSAGSPLLALTGSGRLILTPHCAWGSDRAQSSLLSEVFKIVEESILDNKYEGRVTRE